jgi:hypothetical protein
MALPADSLKFSVLRGAVDMPERSFHLRPADLKRWASTPARHWQYFSNYCPRPS